MKPVELRSGDGTNLECSLVASFSSFSSLCNRYKTALLQFYISLTIPSNGKANCCCVYFFWRMQEKRSSRR